jgi:hypothetical protein
LQLLKVLVFPLSGECTMNSHFTRSTSSECKLSLLITVRAMICQWFPAKCVVNTQFVANILSTDEAEFKREGIVKFLNTHV